MSSQLALLACIVFILWLFARDRNCCAEVSFALWIPAIWIVILASRPVSAWLNLGGQSESASDFAEGSPLDRLFFLVLMLAGFVVLRRRRTNWWNVTARNRWVVIYFLYFGISALWSDYPFVAFKRWIKDIGNVVMVLVILSEENPVEAIRTVFARCLYVLVPLSVLFIKYYPGLGIAYDFLGGQFYQGVTLFKNQLGATVAMCSLFLVWEMFRMRSQRQAGHGKTNRIDLLNRLVLLGMAIWLFRKADSATSFTCTVLGSCGLMVLNTNFARQRANRLLPYAIGGGLLLLVLFMAFDLGAVALKLLGRNSSLTGRTNIWQLVLAEHTNPLIGAGFYSFWSPERCEKFRSLYFLDLNQAHNGYLETYLNGGLIGVLLLLAMLASAGRGIQRQLAVEPEWAGIRLVFWATAIVHGWTEASFSRHDPLWLVLLLMITEYIGPRDTALEPQFERLRGDEDLFNERQAMVAPRWNTVRNVA